MDNIYVLASSLLDTAEKMQSRLHPGVPEHIENDIFISLVLLESLVDRSRGMVAPEEIGNFPTEKAEVNGRMDNLRADIWELAQNMGKERVANLLRQVGDDLKYTSYT